MKIIEKNIYAGTEEPQQIIETAYSKITNEGIYFKVAVNEDGSQTNHWYIMQSTKEIFEDKIKEITEEHDELIAELIEGGKL